MVFGHFDPKLETKVNFSEQLHHFSGLPTLALKKNYSFFLRNKHTYKGEENEF